MFTLNLIVSIQRHNVDHSIWLLAGTLENKRQVWWLIPVIPGLGRVKQEDCCKPKSTVGYMVKFQANLNYRIGIFLKIATPNGDSIVIEVKTLTKEVHFKWTV